MSNTPEVEAIAKEIGRLIARYAGREIGLNTLSVYVDEQLEPARKLERERDQIRKVCDELAEQYHHEMMSMFGHSDDCDCSRCEPMVVLYNSLPHVIERKKK